MFKRTEAIVHDDLPPGNDDLPPGSDDLPPGSDDLPPGSDDLPPGNDDLPPGSDDLSPGSDDLPPESDDWAFVRGNYPNKKAVNRYFIYVQTRNDTHIGENQRYLRESTKHPRNQRGRIKR